MIHARDDYAAIQDSKFRIPDDEPVFIIRAQDQVGAAAVRAWADLHEQAGGDPEMARVAREHASRMDAWPKKKPADLPRARAGRRVRKGETQHDRDLLRQLARHERVHWTDEGLGRVGGVTLNRLRLFGLLQRNPDATWSVTEAARHLIAEE